MAKSPDWLDDDDLFDDEEDLVEDDVADDAPVLKRSGSKREPAPPARRKPDKAEPETAGEAKTPALARLAVQGKRPGEQDIARSPLVLMLCAFIGILSVMAGTYWFMIGRDVVTKELNAIEEDIAEQRFQPAIEKLEDFIIAHGRHERAGEARFLLAKTRVDQQVVGSVPDWATGLEMVELYIRDCRDLEGYSEKKPELLEYSVQIAQGSLKTSTTIARTARNSTTLQGARDLLEVAETSALNIDGFAPEEEPPTKQKAEIKVLRETAEREIHKRSEIHKAYALIEKHLNAKRPIPALKARRDVIVQYSDLEKDRKLTGYLEEALAIEKGLISKEALDRAALTGEEVLPVPRPLSLTPHTRSSTEETSDGRNVYAVAQGCCYGIDTVTGDTVWRRSIGPDTPFFPVTVDTTIPGLLVFDTASQELVLLNRLTGELGWKQPVEEPVSGEPLIHDGQVYLPTLGNHLYKIDIQTGRATSRLTFSQPVYSPPVLLRDSPNLVVAGDEGVTYVIGLRAMECVVVWPTFQPPKSIDVPMLAMGSLVLMAENSAGEGCTLRVFDATDIENAFPEVGTTVIPTQVRNPLLLRGNRLFVPAVGEQFSVFTVSDSKEQEPLLDIARPPSRSEYDGEVFLLGGPDGRLWTASDSLRKFQLTQDALPEDQEKRIFIGASGQPLQKIGETLFVGQRGLGSDALRLVQVDGEAMTEYGKTIVGTGVVTVLPVGSDSLLCLTRTGELFQVTAQKLETGGFLFRPDGQLKIPADVGEPLMACVLSQNRMAVTCGGKTPQLWIVNQSGKVIQEARTNVPAVLAPVPLAGGAIVPQPATLQLLGFSDNRTVEEFLGTVEQQDTVQWSSIVPVDSEHVLVTGQDGRITRVGYRGTPKPHLQRVESLEVGQKVHVPPAVGGNRVVVSDASGRIQLLDAAGFRQQAETTLAAPAFGELHIVGERLIVQTEDHNLHCLTLDSKLEKVWSIEMQGDAVSGTPLVEDGLLITGTMNGRVLKLDIATGEQKQVLQLDQPIEHGPFRVGSYLVVVSIDGSLYRVESSPGEGS